MYELKIPNRASVGLSIILKELPNDANNPLQLLALIPDLKQYELVWSQQLS